MLFACETGVPDDELLEASADRNPHGAGMAWIETTPARDKTPAQDVVRFKKGLDLDGVHRLLEKVQPPLLIHFRYASVGPIVPQLTHPFPLTPHASLELEGTSDVVLAHNGHIGGWKMLLREAILSGQAKAPKGYWSDTRALAYLTTKYGSGIIPIVTDDDRVVLFTRNGEFIIFGNWIENEAKGFSQSQTLTVYKNTKIHAVGGRDFRPQDDWRNRPALPPLGQPGLRSESPNNGGGSTTGPKEMKTPHQLGPAPVPPVVLPGSTTPIRSAEDWKNSFSKAAISAVITAIRGAAEAGR